ncbi:MAG: CsbD family protein, partial [Gammaproteobacteria bacterium]
GENTMQINQDIVKGKWKEIKGGIKQKWGKFTDDEVAQMQGSYEELLGNVQKKYGYQKEQAKQEIDEFLDDNHWKD